MIARTNWMGAAVSGLPQEYVNFHWYVQKEHDKRSKIVKKLFSYDIQYENYNRLNILEVHAWLHYIKLFNLLPLLHWYAMSSGLRSRWYVPCSLLTNPKHWDNRAQSVAYVTHIILSHITGSIMSDCCTL